VSVSSIPQSAYPRPPGLALDEVRTWPATVDVAAAAVALGVSRAHAYECIKLGTFPARILRVGGRVRVITASIIATLEGVA